MNKFAERLKELREENDLSMTMLSRVLDVSESTISRWENGDILPSIEHLRNMAVYFKVSADYLIGLED